MIRILIISLCSLCYLGLSTTTFGESTEGAESTEPKESSDTQKVYEEEIDFSPAELPSIGAVSTTSQAEEKRLGQAWLKFFRRQVPLSSDALLIEYTENLLKRLSKYNPDAGADLTLVIPRDSSINAFAVPGGIIGVNTGLFAYAQAEAQFASVLAHELAHLSQRHYARGVQKRKGQSVLSTAALIGSILIAAAGGGEAGIAALQASQAGLIDSQLRFSRAFEQEADRLGMATLVAAGFNPHSMADMFEQIQRSTRFSSRPPEFLLTHPVTAKRIADAANRARSYPSNTPTSSLDYDLMRARVLFSLEKTPQQAVSRFESELRGFSASEVGTRYGLALAYIAVKEYDEAQQLISELLEQHPNHPALIIAQSSIEAGSKQLLKATNRIKSALVQAPDSYPLNMRLSRLHAANNDYRKAIDVLNKLSIKRPGDTSVWFNLAEYSGLAGDILGLHKARAEFFILRASFDRAENQVNNIIKKFSDNEAEVAKAKQRLQDIKEIRKVTKL